MVLSPFHAQAHLHRSDVGAQCRKRLRHGRLPRDDASKYAVHRLFISSSSALSLLRAASSFKDPFVTSMAIFTAQPQSCCNAVVPIELADQNSEKPLQ